MSSRRNHCRRSPFVAGDERLLVAEFLSKLSLSISSTEFDSLLSSLDGLEGMEKFDDEFVQKLVYDALVWSSLHGLVVGDKTYQYFQKSYLGLTKSMNFFQNIIKPFKRSSNRGLEDDIERIAALEQKVFSFQVLVSATKNFHQTHKLGEGGFGPVFKGRLPDGRDIAVKRLAQASRHCRTLLRSYGDQLGIDSERVPRNASTRQFADAMAKAWLE